MKTYVIHFDKLKERKKQLEEQLNNIKSLNPEWIIQKGYYSKELLNKYYEYDKKEWIRKIRMANRVVFPYELTRSQQHIVVNHMIAREKVAKGKEDYALIIEDDALFCEDFDNKLEKTMNMLKNKEWDIVYFAYHLNDEEQIPETNRLTLTKEKEKYSCYGAGAYLLRKDVAKKITNFGEKITIGNDEELKYRINKLNLNVYWVIPPLIKQSSKEEDGKSSRDDLSDNNFITFQIKAKQYLDKLPLIRKPLRKGIHKAKKIYLGVK